MATTTSAAGSSLPAGYLSTQGSQIVDAAGTPVRIASIGWNQDFSNIPSSVAAMRAAGFNTIRVSWVNASMQSDLQRIDQIVSAATANGMKVILDNHTNEPGHGPQDNWGAQQPNGLWYDVGGASDGTDGGGNRGTVTQDKFRSDWVEVAKHYAGNSTVIGFDIRNEPTDYGKGSNWGSGDPNHDIRMMYQAVGNAIQAVNSGPLIIAEGSQDYSRGVPWGDLTKAGSMPVSLGVPNKVVYSVHDYPKEIAGWAQDNGAAKVAAMNADWGYLIKDNIAPVWIGEMGSSMAESTDAAWAATLLDYMNGRLGAQGGPTFTGNQQGVSGDWWAWGYLPGQLPDGTNNASGTLKAIQQAVWSQMLYHADGATAPPPVQPPPTIPASPDNTVVTTVGPAIVDSKGNAWTLTADGRVAVNGAADANTGRVTQLAYEKGQVWQQNADKLWWSKTLPSDPWGPAMGTSASPIPNTPAPPHASGSPDNTVITAAGQAIVDAKGNAWSLTADGKVAVNGMTDATTGRVIKLAYEGGKVWQENQDQLWWGKSAPGDAWGPAAGTSTSPIPGAGGGTTTPPPTQTGTVGDWLIRSINGMQYMVLLPDHYDPSVQYAATLYLHQLDMGNAGPGMLQGQINSWFNTPEFRAAHPSIVVAPILDQNSDTSGQTINWGGVSTANTAGENNAIAALKQVMGQYSVDTSRVYVTGNSMGGIGTEDLMIKYNAYTGTQGKIFAGGLALAGADYGQGYPTPNPSVVTALKDVPLWAIHGAGDTQVPLAFDRALYAAEQAIGGKMKYTEDKNLGHDVWDTYYPQAGANSPLNWLYQQKVGVTVPPTGGGTGTPGTPASPDNTIVTGTAGQIVDASGNKWTITADGKVAVNGTPDAATGRVVRLAFESGKVWQENADHLWWAKAKPTDAWGPAAGTATSPIPGGPVIQPPSTGGTVIGSGSDTIVVLMSEDADGPAGAAGRDAQFTLNVDGKQIGGLQTVTSSHAAGQTQTFTFAGNFDPGAHKVAITFANNSMTQGDKAAFGYGAGDRNLYVDSLTFNGQAVTTAVKPIYTSPLFPPNGPLDLGNAVFAVNDATAVPAGAPSTPSTTPAAIEFGTGADTLKLFMSEDPYLGDAQFTVTVDGKAVGGTFTTTAMSWQGQQQEFDLHGSWGAGNHTVGVTYVNDKMGAADAQGNALDATDRNLYVNGLSYDGTTASGTPWELSSNGSHTFAVSGTTPPVTTPPVVIPPVVTPPASSPSIDVTVSGGYKISIGGDTVGTVNAAGDVFQLAAPGVARVVLGAVPETLRFTAMSSVNLTAGSAAATVTADAGTNTWVCGKGALDVTGGSGADAFVYHAGAAAMTIRGFGVGADTLSIDNSLKASLTTAADGFGGTKLSFGSGGGIDLRNVTTVPTSAIHWT